jgi:hypothetical protein
MRGTRLVWSVVFERLVGPSAVRVKLDRTEELANLGKR